jgi:hypothetical protein
MATANPIPKLNRSEPSKTKPSLFKRLLRLSGLAVPFGYLCTFILEPVCDRILEWEYPARLYPIEAQGVRDAAKELGLDCFPLLLSEHEQCPTCRKWVGMLVQPNNVCFYCWGDTEIVLRRTNHLHHIEENTAKTVTLLESMTKEQAETNGYLKAVVDLAKK